MSINLSNHTSVATVSTVSNESTLKYLQEFSQNASFDLRAVSLDQALEIVIGSSGYKLKLSTKIANDRYLAMRMIDKPLWLTTEAILQGNCLSAQVQNEQTLFIYPNPNQTACLPSKFPNISADNISSVPFSASINDMTTLDALSVLFTTINKNFVASITAIKPSRVMGVWNDQKVGLIFQQITQASCYNYKFMSPDV